MLASSCVSASFLLAPGSSHSPPSCALPDTFSLPVSSSLCWLHAPRLVSAVLITSLHIPPLTSGVALRVLVPCSSQQWSPSSASCCVGICRQNSFPVWTWCQMRNQNALPVLERLLYERPALGRRHLKQPPVSLHLSPAVKTLLAVTRLGSF